MLVTSDKWGWTKTFPWPAFQVFCLAQDSGLILGKLREPRAAFSVLSGCCRGLRSATQWMAFFTVTLRGDTAVAGGSPLSGCKGQAHQVKQAVKSLQPLFSLYTPLQRFLSPPPGCWQRSSVPLFTLTQLHFIHLSETENRSRLGSGCDPNFCSPRGQA